MTDSAFLDTLSFDELNALDFGVVQVDRHGTILFYNHALSRLSGRAPDEVIGRNLFQDVAPATRVPAFYGRFREFVRRKASTQTFSLIRGLNPAPVRATVELLSSRDPDRYWILVHPQERLEPRLLSEPALAVGRRVRAEPVDPSICEREPIHIPGSIQPYAALLALDRDSMMVTACSANVDDVLGQGADTVLGQAIAELLPPDLVELIRSKQLAAATPARTRVSLGAGGDPFLASVHQHGGRIIVELERLAWAPEDFSAIDPLVAEDALARLRSPTSVQALAQEAVEIIRDLTGFERVLVYRFDPNWNGEAIAESRTETWDHSLAGLHFPASDIPSQARALYTRSLSRYLVDRDYVPVPLLAHPDAEQDPVDLTFAQSRSLSPVHLEYQRNLGVNGSMSASILVEGRLWGLVIGHHRKPHYVPPETRSAVAVIVNALAAQVSESERSALWQSQQEHLRVETQLLQQMAAADDLVSAISSEEVGLLDLFGSSGAALIVNGTVTNFGVTPPAPRILDLLERVRNRDTASLTFATDHLTGVFPDLTIEAADASGCLVAFANAAKTIALVWFKPEVISTVTWGGDPRKPVMSEPGVNAVLPRRSFERWVEERRRYSEPWPAWQVGIAGSLAAAMDGVVVRQSRKVEELVGLLHDKERLLVQKEILTREIDHRVKNSLQIVSSFLQMQARTVSDPEARDAFTEAYGRVMSVARVHNSLYQSEDVEEVDVGQTVESLCTDLAELAGDGSRLEVEAQPGIMVPYKTGVALALIATELVTNAFKYAQSEDDIGTVRVGIGIEAQGRVCLSVSDSGPGLPPDWKTRPKRGLGMRLINAMLTQIEATLDVESNSDGAHFRVCA
ncbi:histidine kinase dimerization/phosphoacceptor domain -containing protein [Microvirga arabica]|uniref:Blue-light-activated histidine kinase n=1 Tax=Microvirga arabica TaxID=1128671 RepID=A0ABV6Y5F3_9HYPH